RVCRAWQTAPPPNTKRASTSTKACSTVAAPTPWRKRGARADHFRPELSSRQRRAETHRRRNQGRVHGRNRYPKRRAARRDRYVDGAIGQMVEALQQHDLLESTAIVITAKHGQSPVDPHRF